MLVERLWNIVDKAPWPSTTSLTAHVEDPITMPLTFDSSIPTPSNFSHFLNGPGMRIATWRHPNHSEKWDDKRDEEVIARAKENVAQFPEFTKRLVRSLRETDSH